MSLAPFLAADHAPVVFFCGAAPIPDGYPLVFATDFSLAVFPYWLAEPGCLLQAATINNARLLKREADYGTVAVGRVANLLLLDQNPLESAEAYQRIQQVILRGQPIERQLLAAR